MKNRLLAGIDVEGIIKKSIEPVIDDLTESYVAQPKTYNQVSEFVSQKTKDAHSSLYRGYVETLNRVSAELDTASRGESDSRHSTFRSLKLDEVTNINAVWLHELYFANCFDAHSEIFMDSVAYLRLERDFGTFEDWQKDIMACAMACGQGWAVCGYNMFLKRFVNTVVSDNSHNVMLGLFPMVVIDLHEHAYSKDYLTDKKSYIVAMMRELNWNVINERFAKAESVHNLIK